MPHVNIVTTPPATQCPACREHLLSAPTGQCSSCEAWHHSACLAEMGCSSLGCRPGGTRRGEPDDSRILAWYPWGPHNASESLHVLCDLDTILNDGGYYSRGELMVVWVGAYGSTSFLCYGHASESLEEVARWCSEHAPGYLTEPEYPICDGGTWTPILVGTDDGAITGRRCTECGSLEPEDHAPRGWHCADCGNDPAYGPCEHFEEAEADLTYCDPGLWIPSHEWGMSTADHHLMRAAKAWAMERTLAEERGHIITELCRIASHLEPDEDDDDERAGTCEVRLQVDDDGRWILPWGDASYDTDHGGHWGIYTISWEDDGLALAHTADELIRQVTESYVTRLHGVEDE